MMKISFTSSTRCLVATLALLTCTTCSAATHHRYECPSLLVDGKIKRELSHIEVFDGPPKDMASLIPAAADDAGILDGLEKVDVYLVCGYKGTDKIITIHALGATICKGTDHPSAAFCD
jgi:hypothetical protein